MNPMIEEYFSQLEGKLSDFPASERGELVRELRAHVLDRLEQVDDARAVLKALGTPEEIARQYRLERIMNRSVWKISPLRVLRTLLRWTVSGVQGYTVFTVAFLGYALALCLYLGALMKPLFPHNVGFFVGRHGFELAAWPQPNGAAVLDPYFIPIAGVLGYLFTVGTTLAIRMLMRQFGNLKRRI